MRQTHFKPPMNIINADNTCAFHPRSSAFIGGQPSSAICQLI
jgi:hypothetical protein